MNRRPTKRQELSGTGNIQMWPFCNAFLYFASFLDSKSFISYLFVTFLIFSLEHGALHLRFVIPESATIQAKTPVQGAQWSTVIKGEGCPPEHAELYRLLFRRITDFYNKFPYFSCGTFWGVVVHQQIFARSGLSPSYTRAWLPSQCSFAIFNR